MKNFDANRARTESFKELVLKTIQFFESIGKLNEALSLKALLQNL